MVLLLYVAFLCVLHSIGFGYCDVAGYWRYLLPDIYIYISSIGSLSATSHYLSTDSILGERSISFADCYRGKVLATVVLVGVEITTSLRLRAA